MVKHSERSTSEFLHEFVLPSTPPHRSTTSCFARESCSEIGTAGKSNSEGELCQPEVPELGWTPLATTDSPAAWVVHGNLNRFASFATSAEGIEDESL